MDAPYPRPERERRSTPRESWADRLLDLLYPLLRWIGRRAGGFYGALGLYLAIGFGLLLAAIAAFAGVAHLMAEGLTQRADDAVLLWMNRHASDALTVVALEVTSLGSGAPVYMVVLVGSLFLWITRHRYSVALLWVAMVGANLLNGALKLGFDRPRPQLFEWRTEYAGLSSFPSGHSTTAMVVYATIAYLVVRLTPSRALRRWTLAGAALVILAIGASRLYLGVHYPSDVLAGYLVGFGWATFCALGIEAVRYFRGRKPGVAAKEAGLEKGTEPIRDAVTGGGQG